MMIYVQVHATVKKPTAGMRGSSEVCYYSVAKRFYSVTVQECVFEKAFTRDS